MWVINHPHQPGAKVLSSLHIFLKKKEKVNEDAGGYVQEDF